MFVTLSKIGFAALGPIRTRRFPGLEISSDKDMKIESRRCYEEKETIIDGVKIREVKWLNNKGGGVSLASTFDSAQPLKTV